MKKFKILMMVVLTITSVSIFAQVASNNQTKLAKQNSEKVQYTCPMHPNMVMDNLSICQDLRNSLNLSPKEKMKREGVKIAVGSMNNNEVRSDMPCNSSQNLTLLNLSPKEKRKWESMKIYSSNTNICPQSGMDIKEMNMSQMMNVFASDNQVSCIYSRSPLNLSSKEKMKRETVKYKFVL